MPPRRSSRNGRNSEPPQPIPDPKPLSVPYEPDSKSEGESDNPKSDDGGESKSDEDPDVETPDDDDDLDRTIPKTPQGFKGGRRSKNSEAPSSQRQLVSRGSSGISPKTLRTGREYRQTVCSIIR